MGEELDNSKALLKTSWIDLKKEFKVCNEVNHPTYESINLVIVLIYAFFQFLFQLTRAWYILVFKWFRYIIPTIPYVSTRL